MSGMGRHGRDDEKYSPIGRKRAVCLILDNLGKHESRWVAMLSIYLNISCALQIDQERPVDRAEPVCIRSLAAMAYGAASNI